MVIVPLHSPFRSQFPITSMAICPPTTAHPVTAVFQATRPRSLICTLPLFIIFLIPRPDQVQLQVLHFRRVLFPCASDVMSSKLYENSLDPSDHLFSVSPTSSLPKCNIHRIPRLTVVQVHCHITRFQAATIPIITDPSKLKTIITAHQTITIIMGPPTITTPPSLHLHKLCRKLKWITGMLIRPNVPRFNIGRAEIRGIVLFFSTDRFR